MRHYCRDSQASLGWLDGCWSTCFRAVAAVQAVVAKEANVAVAVAVWPHWSARCLAAHVYQQHCCPQQSDWDSAAGLQAAHSVQVQRHHQAAVHSVMAAAACAPATTAAAEAVAATAATAVVVVAMVLAQAAPWLPPAAMMAARSSPWASAIMGAAGWLIMSQQRVMSQRRSSLPSSVTWAEQHSGSGC